jgi:NADH:ubiquinone oxidoreductase subunit C
LTESAVADGGAFAAVPGLTGVVDAHHETTVVVEPRLLVDASLHLRDELGFNFLSDVTGVDYLGWGEAGVSGYLGTPASSYVAGRDLNAPSTQGYQALPQPKPKRFAMNYHLLKLARYPERVRLQTWIDEDEAVPSVVRPSFCSRSATSSSKWLGPLLGQSRRSDFIP